jgi:hypothetical protein
MSETTNERLNRHLVAFRQMRDDLEATNKRLRADLAQRTAERDALAAEIAALKANDPLAEMWRELAEYQTQADADGHGESWRIMCSERTTPAAWEAWGDAVRVLARHEARVAARSAGDAASLHSAFDAVTAIRKAKEAKP